MSRYTFYEKVNSRGDIYSGLESSLLYVLYTIISLYISPIVELRHVAEGVRARGAMPPKRKSRHEFVPTPATGLLTWRLKSWLLIENILMIDPGLSNCPERAEPGFNKMVLELNALLTINEVGHLLPV